MQESMASSETDSVQTDVTADVLKRRLASAEEDTQLLMRQLEEMGFNTKGDTDRYSQSEETKKSKVSFSSRDVSENPTLSSRYKQQAAESSTCQPKAKISNGNERNPVSKSSKHRPITPLSLKGLIPEAFENTEVKSYDNYNLKPSHSRMVDNGGKSRQRGDGTEGKPTVGRHDVEQELLRMKRIVSQLQEDLQNETDLKLKAREEVEKLKLAVEEISASKAEIEMKVEEASSSKQKMARRVTELKEEASRESSLRASLEESHATLLTRLHDMEAVIENLQTESKTQSSGSNELKSELLKVKEELANESIKRQRVEESYHIVITDKDKLMINVNSLQSDNQCASQELSRLQTQYTDLIRQLEQTKTIVDTLSSSKKNLEEENITLSTQVENLKKEYENIKQLHGDIKESETRLSAEKTSLEEDFDRTRSDKDKLALEVKDKKRKIDLLERELKTTKQCLAQKNEEFSSAADSLEVELAGLKSQLEAMEGEKQLVLRDKESLLEEVNQTVDTLMSERSRLQTELQASCVEAESLRTTCSRLEENKAELLERLGGLQHQQTTQLKVEETLNEMMEQKNRLAYENGKLQSTIDQLQQDLNEITREQGDITQLKNLSQSLQAKYTKSQQEISELKISLQRLEGQAKSALEDVERKDHDLRLALERKVDAEREMSKALSHVEMLEGRQVYKVSHYEKNMSEAKSVNKEIASTLEAVMTSHSQLQVIVENLQVDLGKKDSQICQLKANRNKEQEELKKDIKMFQDKIEVVTLELKKEKEKSSKRVTKEVSEMRKQSDNLSMRNQELVKINQELRQRVADTDKEKEEMKTKMSGQRHKLEYLHKAKKQVEDNLNKMKAVREDIEELEQMRDKYVKKNKEQGETINKFINQITLLQDEMRQLAQAHINAQQLLKLKEDALEREKRIRDELKKKFTESKKREVEMSKKSHISDEKLQEVHSESLEISRHLQQAHDWFSGKFDKLQTEITASKNIQAKLEKDNLDQRRSLEDERSKAQQAAERAKEMIQTSRQTISRLADYAELADVDTKQQLAQLRAELHTPASRLTLKDLDS